MELDMLDGPDEIYESPPAVRVNKHEDNIDLDLDLELDLLDELPDAPVNNRPVPEDRRAVRN